MHARGRHVLLSIGAAIASLVLLEGIASVALFAIDAGRKFEAPLAARQHTIHDPLLGWVNRPGIARPGLYGPGRDVTIDQRGFRGRHEIAPAAPSGGLRLVASGDSFTFGYGVGDGDTWGAKLEHLAPGLEVVNMGQGGYGADQAYLWYERDGRSFEHQVHVFALIWADIDRMRRASFFGYPKPTLELRNGELTVAGTPVPERAFWVPWLTQNAHLLRELRVAEALARILGGGDEERDAPRIGQREAATLLLRALGRMRDGDLAHGSQLVLVWLPTREEYAPFGYDPMREAILAAALRGGIPVVDLVPDLRAVPPNEIDALFLRDDEVAYPGAAGHYSVAGNAWIASRLLERLRALPALEPTWRRLAPAGPGSPG